VDEPERDPPLPSGLKGEARGDQAGGARHKSAHHDGCARDRMLLVAHDDDRAGCSGGQMPGHRSTEEPLRGRAAPAPEHEQRRTVGHLLQRPAGRTVEHRSAQADLGGDAAGPIRCLAEDLVGRCRRRGQVFPRLQSAGIERAGGGKDVHDPQPESAFRRLGGRPLHGVIR
jgi:hypothetical protein